MLRSIIFYIHLFITLLPLQLVLLRTKYKKKKMSIEEYRFYIYKYAKSFATRNFYFSGSKINVVGNENIPNDEPVVFIVNHQSHFDIAVLLAFVDRTKAFVSKHEIRKIPIVGNFMMEIESVIMDRTDMKSQVKAIIDAINVVQSGQSIVIFPEGTRSKSSKIGEFKAGSFKIATKSQAPIVPVTINGTYNIFEANNYKIKPASVDITIHKPIYTKNLTREEILELPTKCFEIISSKL